jgi:hypothetical protein
MSKEHSLVDEGSQHRDSTPAAPASPAAETAKAPEPISAQLTRIGERRAVRWGLGRPFRGSCARVDGSG